VVEQLIVAPDTMNEWAPIKPRLFRNGAVRRKGSGAMLDFSECGGRCGIGCLVSVWGALAGSQVALLHRHQNLQGKQPPPGWLLAASLGQVPRMLALRALNLPAKLCAVLDARAAATAAVQALSRQREFLNLVAVLAEGPLEPL